VLLRRTSCVDLVVLLEVGRLELEVEVEVEFVPEPVGIMDSDFVVLNSAGTVKDQLEVVVPELAG
jgi:hypothetical protein